MDGMHMHSKQKILDEFNTWLKKPPQRYLRDFLGAYLLMHNESMIALFLMAKYPKICRNYHQIDRHIKLLENSEKINNKKRENDKPITGDNVENKKLKIEKDYKDLKEKYEKCTKSKKDIVFFNKAEQFEVANYYIETLLRLSEDQRQQTGLDEKTILKFIEALSALPDNQLEKTHFLATESITSIQNLLEKNKKNGVINDTKYRKMMDAVEKVMKLPKYNRYRHVLSEVCDIKTVRAELENLLPEIYECAYYPSRLDESYKDRYLVAYEKLGGFVNDSFTEVMYVAIKNLWNSPLLVFKETFKEKIKKFNGKIQNAKLTDLQKLRCELVEAWSEGEIEEKDCTPLMDKLDKRETLLKDKRDLLDKR